MNSSDTLKTDQKVTHDHIFHAQSLLSSLKKYGESAIDAEFDLDVTYFQSLLEMQMLYGESFFFVAKIPELDIPYISKEAEQYFDIVAGQIKLAEIFTYIHPDDIDFANACEEKIFHFIYSNQCDDPVNYKILNTLRLKEKNGKYAMYINQAFFARDKTYNRLSFAIHFMTRVPHLSFLKQLNFSIIHMGNGPSYYGIDAFKKNENYLMQENLQFTQREIEVLGHFSNGLTAKEIADKMYLSEGTIRTHRRNILMKSDRKNMTAVVVDCVRQGII